MASPEDFDGLPNVTVQRKVEWSDTDAAGHHYHGAIMRWVEAAEAVLLERRGIRDLFGRIPRVRYEVNYRNRLWFGDLVTIELTVGRIGEKSVRYDFLITSNDVVAADGSLFIANAAPDAPRAVAWPDSVRGALSSGGTQASELLTTA